MALAIPNDWAAHLAGGKPIPMNFLLVGQDGTSYVDASTDMIMSNKVTEPYNRQYSSDNGDTWNNIAISMDLVANSDYTESTGKVFIVNYTSHNTPLTQSTPKPVKLVQDKVIASNSHSWYKGAGLVNAVTGKVSVGNGDNGLESRSLENAEIGISDIGELKTGSTYTVLLGETVTYQGGGVNGTVGSVYERLNSDWVSHTLAGFYGDDNTRWKLIANASIPQHPTLSLDNADSPASKVFGTLAVDDNGEYLVQVIGEEMIWDYGADNGGEFSAKDSSISNSYSPDITYRFTTGDLAGLILTTQYNLISVVIDADYSLVKGNVIRDSDGAVAFKSWDGNGFGDDNTFEQLTNGNITDLNGNTVQTKVLTQRTGVFKDDN